ncbi:MAG: glycine--tRNA ligase [Candidatus Methylacidiphilales bacterium]
MAEESKMEKITALCKRRGFIFQSSEIYGGLNGVWDYGPLGAQLKKNIRDHWWRTMTQLRDDIVGMDGAILMNRAVWKASGHEKTFSDPMVDCKTCKGRFRADQIDQTPCPQKPSKCAGQTEACQLTEPRDFNLMFKTYIGPVQDESHATYLRPETAQAIFVQFKNVLDTSRKKLPFGIAQIGKAFRNEINPRNFTFRSREFEQMELEFFVKPDTGFEWTDHWLEQRLQWYESIGIPRHRIHILDVPAKDLAFYSKKTYDLEYEFPFGIQELEGIAYRTDHDLKSHQEASGKPLEYFDEETKEKFIPHVVEPSAGLDRTLLAVLCEAYDEESVTDEKGNSEVRTVLRFAPSIAPIKAGIFPLLKNKPELVAKAREVESLLRPHMTTFYDESGAIGRRYRRQDEVGTPFGITIDFETLEGVKDGELAGQRNTVTLRHRDSMKQERVAMEDLRSRLTSHLF